MLAVPCQQVRCHKNVNMSSQICVCVDRVSVQMVLPGSSQQTRLQFCGCLKTEPKLLSGNWRVPTPVCDGHVPWHMNSSFIRDNLACSNAIATGGKK